MLINKIMFDTAAGRLLLALLERALGLALVPAETLADERPHVRAEELRR